MRFSLLAAANSHAALGEKVVSIVTKLQYCGVAFGRNDQSLSYKLIKNCPFVPFQIRAGSLQQIAKDRNFEVRDIICHDIVSSLIRFRALRSVSYWNTPFRAPPPMASEEQN